MTDQKTKNEVRVVYADYDYKTRVSALKFGNATISKNGTALIRTTMFGVLKRNAGEYVLAEHFKHEWRACIKQRAEEMAATITNGGNNEENQTSD